VTKEQAALKRLAAFLLVISILVPPVSFPGLVRSTEKAAVDPWEVHFSPNGDCTAAITKELSNSRRSILVQAYSFTSAPIAKALLNAHKRGVKVEIILDKSQRTQKYSSVTFFMNSGIPIRIDAAHAIAHNKVIIVDEEIVITGSFNFTKAAEEKNAENLLVIHDKRLASLYIKNWREHARHSEASVSRGG
jgi:phosphatidylserine/phosphatidylglycerophosphate/cardiolipin synthase-like enzyme